MIPERWSPRKIAAALGALMMAVEMAGTGADHLMRHLAGVPDPPAVEGLCGDLGELRERVKELELTTVRRDR